MKKIILSLCISACLGSIVSNNAIAEDNPVKTVSTIEAFATMPQVSSVSVSPNGQKIAIVRATNREGDYIVEIRDTKDLGKKPVILGADRMKVQGVSWLNNEKIGVSFRQLLESGAHKYWTGQFAITDANGKGKWVLPSKKVRGFGIIDLLPNNKNEVLAQADTNSNGTPDVIRYNIKTNNYKTIMRGNSKQEGSFTPDADGEIRGASGWNRADTTIDLYARKKGSDDWQRVRQISPNLREQYEFLGFSKDRPNDVYIKANLGEDKAGIYTYNLENNIFSERLFGLENVDVDGVSFNPYTQQVTSYNYTSKHPQKYFVDESEQILYDSLKSIFKGKHVSITSRSKNDNAIIVRTMGDQDTGTFYLITDKKKVSPIGERLPLVDKSKLGKVKFITYKARDGRKVKAYVTIPSVGEKPYPAVVMPHGGPWARDINIFDEWSQLLASHGYIVIQPQFRGSEGFGLDHWKAGDKNWGLTMQDDNDDAALFLVKKGLASKDKLAIYGWSYGGYAAFVGSMRDNNIYQCAAAGAGVGDLGRWSAYINDNRFARELQRPTVKGISPVNQVDKVNIPLLVVHGDIDSRVTVKHSRAFVDKLKKYGKDYKYVELEDADHFSNTLFYPHKKVFYTELLNWLDNKCGMKPNII
ncbi:S9 family peptidase [Parashewanella spongiae]|uniref:S9 family peptidase n=1 Tax=Parashewanella spongiae TaxID=342950 RepID=A0A3A6U3P5_9GAMM|nr:prolyl oligopeptidase family serine peptidase [Parashewanella spongiae]MCL1078095.1 prolyl oligopeptidase family serine peptidase [Parashewanella spongiae]RJY16465.1 S9 family peptidase [Parashewanella spongiae]